ncbi:MAG: sulfatase [Bacteroidota bacterium]
MKRRIKQFLLLSVSILLLAGCWQCSSKQSQQITSTPPNFLFIAIDDLRPQLGCYGEQFMHTPNLDQLANEGRLFKNHYVQVPTCGASRFSLLLGQYPQYKKHLSNQVFRDDLAQIEQAGRVPLPKLLKQNGYYTSALGKISHYVDGKLYAYNGQGDGTPEMPDSWNYEWGPIGKWGTAWNAFFGYADGSNRNDKKKQVPPTEFVAENDGDLPDGLIAQKAISELERLQKLEQPFFLAVGFLKPHLPFVAPKKYWELYENVNLPLSPIPEMPLDIPAEAIQKSGELFGNYQIQPEKGGRGIRLSDEYALHLRRSYFAAVSYTDAQVGKLMQTLRQTGLDKNTVIVLWGDHGWHLGDHTVWGKHTLFEQSLRSAFIIKTPQMLQAGQPTDAIVESIDIYPTLLELSRTHSENDLMGKSLTPLLENPEANLNKPAIGFWHNGVTIRTADYRLTKFKVDETIQTVLYDHQKDENETENVAATTGYSSIVKELERQLFEQSPTSFWESL